jgi:hypothetical protein
VCATVRDRSLASQRLGVLVTKQGADAFTIGVMDTPEARHRNDAAAGLSRSPLTHVGE